MSTTIEAPQQIETGVRRIADGLVNWYVIEERGELTLIDAGWPRSWPRIEQSLRDLGYRPDAISAIVLTHGHPDHLGAAARAKEASGASVYVHRDEVDRVRGEAKGASPFALVPSLLPHLWRPSATGFVLHATARGFMTPTWVKNVRPFDSGEQLDVPGRPRVVATPGHTAGHVSLLLEDRGVLFTGDALSTLDPLTRDEGPLLISDALNGDPEVARSSLGTIARVDAGTLLPGHGEPFVGDARSAATQARERAGDG